ncbi:MAG TPA: S9 family peptidase [Virgibacillus sp.]|nr:S9 family peptidase [Virgibacillus sp.]HLR67783.1 S9 family peptidase [Virgibacillus sp.]
MVNDLKQNLLKKYLHVDEAYDPAVIPGQTAITFLSKKSGLPQVWKWDRASKSVEQYTYLPDRVLSVHHSNSGDQTIVGMDKDGNEKQQLYLLEQNGEEAKGLIVSEEHFHQFGGWSPNDQKIAYTSNRRNPGYFDIYVYDFSTKKESLLYEVNGQCTPVCWTKDGKQIILIMAETNIDRSLYLLHVERKELSRIGEEATLARYASVELTKDGQRGFLLSDTGQNTLGAFQFSFQNTKELEPLFSNEQWDIEEIKLSPTGEILAYTINEGGISKLGYYFLGSQEHKTIASLPNGVYQSLAWMTENELVVGVKSATIPGDIWKVDIVHDTAERLTSMGEDKEINHLLVEPELCYFTSFDGLKVPYFLYGKKHDQQPAVVYVHGGPEHQIRMEFNPVIQFLACKGFAVAAPNVRGSMGYGRKYVKLDDVRKRMDAVADLKWLTKDLIKNHAVEGEKIGIMGRSYGGFMVLAALTHYPEIWAAGVDIVGISHFKTFLENTGPWRRRLREFEYGSLAEDIDFFEKIAPLNHTDKITSPLLVFHGRNDTRVPVTEAEQLTADLKEQGKHVELHIFEDEGHQTEKIENHITMNTKIIEFMEKFLV